MMTLSFPNGEAFVQNQLTFPGDERVEPTGWLNR